MKRDLRLDDVGRRYGLRGPWVLRNVQLQLAPGSLTRIDGPNGSGKSTLLRLLAGIDVPTEGRVTGRPRTAYVPERFPAALPFTAVGYLTHLGTVHGLSRAAAGRAADEWLDRFGAAAHARTPMTRLSKGSSQKVAVAQALLAEPELLILDEAWTGLDTDARAELERAVAERTAADATVVFVDHDPHRLAGAADTAYTVRDGRLHRRTGGDPTVAPDGPYMIIEVRCPTGRLPAEALRLAVRAEETAERTHRLTVPASHSDVLLRTLLTARPPWHVVSVRRDESQDDGQDDGQVDNGVMSQDDGRLESQDDSQEEGSR
ncbi:ATP-binding cassette domain-containing protein [Streptomyces sp. NPDC058291]|uniref:ATP-binding cassette domain-containing protein n=1 Tax=Streptomyces sp. NPDC058291 TaxID=3346427 RepID=UPI0036E3E594